MRTVLIEAAGEEQLVHHGAHAVYGHKDSLLVWDVEPLQHHGARVGRTWPCCPVRGRRCGWGRADDNQRERGRRNAILRSEVPEKYDRGI
jgi:hypothetical protein